MVTTLASGFITNFSSSFKVKAFTLIEAIVVIAIMAVVAGIAAPVIFTALERVETESTWEEMENIYTALMGDPETGNYGYLGDMGILPASLADLNSLGGPAYTMKSNGIGMGWNGPYLLKGKNLQDYLYDAWGNNYNYSFSYNDPSVGCKGQVRVFSNGLDKSGSTSDDFGFTRNITTHQNIQVNVYVWQSGAWVTPENYTGTLYYSNAGVEAGKAFSKASPVVTWVHKGMHAIYGVASGSGYNIEGWKNFYVGEGTTIVDMYLKD